ncbi:ABC transporter substrate-binding protein [Amycolatopsis sp. MtRt-6]|uniref:ABC transporter substrate-binding protein n=1 Tax=Amycolatopsis sp. MtRt-6 TaxID=2792782 RepID=UPI001A8DD1EC|nr:ABC transporter substrate-binding protein [Amycolatopsis sp. MtRt-6]
MSVKTTRRRVASLLAGVVALASGVSACSSGSSAGAANGETLTISVSGDPLNLDTANCVPLVFCSVAYDPLIHISPGTGELQPGLATSWEWVDKEHRTFRLTLRQGAKFGDGAPLNGEAAAASLNSYLQAPGPFASLSYPLKGAQAAGSDKVDVQFAEPVSTHYALYLLAGQSGVGYVVGPKGAADRKNLLADTDGIGPYKLDPTQTVKSVKYVYVPNRQYPNQDAIKYEKVVLKPVMNPQTRLNSIRSGEVDWALNIAPTDLSAVTQSGASIARGPLGSFASMALIKRANGPLADERVRQALAYATPRQDIATAIFGTDAVPTSSVVADGAEGRNAGGVNQYAYNPEKARQLLAEAGHANGLKIQVFDPSFFDPGSAVGQALKAAYAKVGVTLDLVPSDASPGVVAQQMGKYDAVIMTNGANGLSEAVFTMFRPMGLANPLGVPLDPQLTDLMRAAATTADPQDQEAKIRIATARLDELVYAVPIASIPTLQAISSKVANVREKFWTIEMNPFSPVASEAWRPAK